MLNFFTKLLTPLFIGLGLVNPSPEIPQNVPTIETQLIQEVNSNDSDREIIDLENQISKEVNEITEEEVSLENYSTSTTTYIKPKVLLDISNVNPICGPANKKEFTNIPFEGLCNLGISSSISADKYNYLWNCSLNNKNIECSASKKVDGKCGIPDRDNLVLQSNYNKEILCEEGWATTINENSGKLSWICSGLKDTYSAKCSAFVEIDGKCGDAEGEMFESFPPDDQACKTGKLENTEESEGEFKWKCTGMNGGSSKSCSAEIKESKNPQNTCTGRLCPANA